MHKFFYYVDFPSTWEGLVPLMPSSVLDTLEGLPSRQPTAATKKDLAYWTAREVGQSDLTKFKAIPVTIPWQWRPREQWEGVLVTDAGPGQDGDGKWLIYLRQIRSGEAHHILVTPDYSGSWSEAFQFVSETPPVGAGIIPLIFQSQATLIDVLKNVDELSCCDLGCSTCCYGAAAGAVGPLYREIIRALWRNESEHCLGFDEGAVCGSETCNIYPESE